MVVEGGHQEYTWAGQNLLLLFTVLVTLKLWTVPQMVGVLSVKYFRTRQYNTIILWY